MSKIKTLTATFLLSLNASYSHELLNPEQVAKEEVAAWKDYYNNDITGLIQHLSHLVIVEFRINQIAAWTTIIPELATSAALFKNLPHSTTEQQYRQVVLPHLTSAFTSIKESIDGDFDPNKAAELELQWWMYRRENNNLHPEIVGKKMSDLYELIYGKKDGYHFDKAGYLRAVAAKYRDTAQGQLGGVEETDWQIIENILKSSYEELVKGIVLNKKINEE